MSSWITFDTTGGTGNTTITITAASSTELNYRIKTLRAETTSHKKTANVVVTQEKYILQLSASTEYLYFSGDTGETQEVCVFSNTAWTVSTNENWIHTSKSGSTGDDCFNVTTDGLTGDDLRWGEITITDGENTLTVFVVQSGDDYHYLIGVYKLNNETSRIAPAQTFFSDDNLSNAICQVNRNGMWSIVDWANQDAGFMTDCSYYHGTLSGTGYFVVEFDLTNGHNDIDLCLRGHARKFNKEIPGTCFFDYDIGNIKIEFLIITEGHTLLKSPYAISNMNLKKIEIRSSALEMTESPNTMRLVNLREYRVLAVKETEATYVYGVEKSDYLTKVTIPSYTKYLGRFRECNNLTDLSFLPSGLKGLEGFTSCNGITSFVFPPNLEYIGESAFEGCQNLSQISRIPNITEIRNKTFYNCPSLNIDIIIPNTCTSIGESAFAKTPIKSFTFDNLSVLKTIGSAAFSETNIITISLPYGVETIGNSAFENCLALSYISWPETTGRINGCMFQGCTSLQSVHIPKSVSTVCGGAFYNCTNLDTIRIDAIDCPVSERYVKQNHSGIIPGIYYDSPFFNVKSGGTLYYPIGSDYSLWESTGSVQSSSTETAYAYYLGKYRWNYSETLTPSGETLLLVPSFSGKVPGSGQDITIAIYTNYYWTGETTELIPLTTHGGSWGSDELIVNPDNGLGNYLVTLSFPPNHSGGYRIGKLTVTTDHGSANVSFTQDIIYEEKPIISITYDIEDNTNPTLIYSGTSSDIWAYRIDYGEWIEQDISSATTRIDVTFNSNGAHLVDFIMDHNSFSNALIPRDSRSLIKVVEMDNSITSIPTNVFLGCSNMISCNLSTNITSIPEYAFCGCTSLSSYINIIHSGITNIGSNAFSHNNFSGTPVLDLTNVSLNTSAFTSCSGLTDVIIGTNVPQACFECTYSLTGVTFAQSGITIGNRAFCETRVLNPRVGGLTFTLPVNCPSIGEEAFKHASSSYSDNPNEYVNLNFPFRYAYSSQTPNLTIGENAFYGSSSIGLGTIKTISFYESGSVESPAIANTRITLSSNAFANNGKLERINLASRGFDFRYSSNSFINIKSNGEIHLNSWANYAPKVTNTNQYNLGYYGWTEVKDL